MMQRMTARMMVLMLMVNLVLCVPLRVAAEGTGEKTFEADTVTVETTTTEDGTQTNVVVVTEEVPAETVGADASVNDPGVAVGEQTVSVEIPVEEATTLTPVEGKTPEENKDNTAIEYDATAPTEEGTTTEETIHVEESYDLKVDVTAAEEDASGQLTDIEYDVSLEQEVSETTPTTQEAQQAAPTASSSSDSDDSWEEPVKVNLSVNGMEDDPTRVEHKYTDNEGKVQTEYYYNAEQVEKGSDKKTFTVTVKEVANAVTEKVVSLWTNFLGIFHITNDAFENQNTKEMSTTLDEAVNGANNGDTVTMLRDYSTNLKAELTNSDGKGSDVTVDLNKNTYAYTWAYDYDYEAIAVNGTNQNLTIQNGAIESSDDVLVVNGSGNQVIIDNSILTGKAASSWTVQTSANSSNSVIKIQNNSTVSGYISAKLSGLSNTLTVENSTLNASGRGVNIGGESQNLNIDNGKINSKAYGVVSIGDEHSLKVQNGSDIKAASGGVYMSGSSQTLAVDNSQVSSDSIGVWAGGTGKENTITINKSTISSKNRGVEVDTDSNYLIITESDINAADIGIGDFGTSNTIKVEKSKVTTNGDGSLGIYHNGSTGGADIQVIGTYVSADGEGSWGIYVSGSKSSTTSNGMNNLILTDSTIEGRETGVEVKYTNVTINNSELVGFGVPPTYVGNNNGTTTSGAALAVTDNRTFNEDGTVKSSDNTAGTITINSGYFNGHKDIDNIFVAAKLNANDSQATIHLNGGRFVNAAYLYKYTDANHAVVSPNDGSDYPYAVVGADAVPSRPGYTFLGYKDDKGNDITLKDAIANKTIAYAQWEKVVEAEETPVKTPTAEAPKEAVIIVEPDSKGNNVEVTIQGTTAQVAVSTPDGDVAAVSEVTVTSVEELRGQGVETICVQVEENVTLELGVAKDADNGLGDTIVITRNEDTLVISSGEETNITIHMAELKAASPEAVHIRYDEGVITVSFGSRVVFRMEVLEALMAQKDLTVKLEGKILKLYDRDNNLIQQIPM